MINEVTALVEQADRAIESLTRNKKEREAELKREEKRMETEIQSER